MVLVDSSIWIEAARRQGDLAAKVGLEGLLEEYEATLSSPAVLEVLGGARKSDREKLKAYFAALPHCPLEEADWLASIRNAWKLRDAGLSIPWNDILIATLSLRLQCRVYAMDSHFESMRTILGIRLYEPGPGGTFLPEVQ